MEAVNQETQLYYHAIKDKEQQEILFNWWKDLENHKGDKAKLKHAQSPEEVLLQSGFHRLSRQLPQLEKYQLMALATIAGLLALVKSGENLDHALPTQLGKTKDHSKTPVFSELRFQKLLASQDATEFYRSLQRAIMIVSQQTHPLLLADSILHWFKEKEKPDWYSGQKSFHYRWARAYYQEVLKYEEKK